MTSGCPKARRPSPALIVAAIALVARCWLRRRASRRRERLPQRSQAGRGDQEGAEAGAGYEKALKRNAVTGKALAAAAVAAEELGPAAVTNAAIAAGAVTPEKIADPAAPRGRLARRAGVQQGRATASADAGDLELGRVRPTRRAGYVRSGSRADRRPRERWVCDLNDAGEAEDGVVFALPARYLPAEVVFTFATPRPRSDRRDRRAGAAGGHRRPGRHLPVRRPGRARRRSRTIPRWSPPATATARSPTSTRRPAAIGLDQCAG